MNTFAMAKKHTASVAAFSRLTLKTTPSWSAYQTRVHNILRGQKLQPQLSIGKPDDKYEREADRIADQVMRIPDAELIDHYGRIGQTPGNRVQRLCSKCEDELQRQPVTAEEEDTLQTQAASGAASEISAEVESRIHALKGGGRPLPERVRVFYERRFAQDFSQVRMHTDPKASASARTLSASAYTVGRNIVFAAGRYAPGTEAGGRLLAHELTHVIQQRGMASGAELPLQLQATESSPDEESADPDSSPQKRPASLELQAFPVTRDICDCVPDIERARDHMDMSITALNACESSSTTNDELEKCKREHVAKEASGLPRLELSGTVNYRTGVVVTKAEAGSCSPVLEAGARRWAIPELRFSRMIAESITDPQFLEEYDKLEGDKERFKKLSARFPKETAKWREIMENVPTQTNLTRQGYRKASQFFRIVLALMRPGGWVCPKPAEEQGPKEAGAEKIGRYIVVPDPKNRPTEYWEISDPSQDLPDQPFERRPYFEIEKDEGGLFYRHRKRDGDGKQYLPIQDPNLTQQTISPPVYDWSAQESRARKKSRNY